MSNAEEVGLIKQTVELIERLQKERDAVDQAIKDAIAAAKAAGLDVRTLKVAIKIRAQDQAARAEADALVSTYLDAAR